MKKSELRKVYLERRASLSAGEVQTASQQIADRLFEDVDLAPITSVHTFVSIAKFNEIDTSIIVRRLWRDLPGIVTVAPKTDLSTGTIESVTFDEAAEWSENSWGIREPANGDPMPPADIDMVIVPLLCFDRQGHRVGYGKGMYDRYLARCRPDCLKVGVSLFPPVEVIDDVTASDIPLDLCITPAGSFRFD